MTDGPKVVSLRGNEVLPPGTPNPDVIAHAESLLEMARAGEISALVSVTLYRDDATGYRLSGGFTRSVLGACVVAQHRLCQVMGE